MNIAIIGTGNVGGALATGWSTKGHTLRLGVRDSAQFKGKELYPMQTHRYVALQRRCNIRR